MISLDVGDQLVDREKSRIFLHYLANAAKKVQERALRHRKTEIAVKQFNKLDTVHLDKQLGTIEDHLQQALRQEQMLLDHQKKEGRTHDELQHKIKKLEHKLTRYVQTEAARKRRVRELDLKIKTAHAHKGEREKKIMQALADLVSLKKRFGAKASPAQHARIELKIEHLKHELSLLKKN